MDNFVELGIIGLFISAFLAATILPVSSEIVLGLIILIRTFLSVTLHLEVEGRWPWQTEKQSSE
jgi:membrane protein YqaA with SNARE-associated domain